MIELPVDLPAELVPLSWLLGVWEGSGVIDYKVGDESVTHEFGQRVSFSHDGLPHLNYTSYTWLFPDDADGDADAARDRDRLLAARARAGRRRSRARRCCRRSAMRATPTPRRSRRCATPTAASTSRCRSCTPAASASSTSARSRGRASTSPPTPSCAPPARRTTRRRPALYGLVDDHLLWAWDIAALGQDLRTHASARWRRSTDDRIPVPRALRRSSRRGASTSASPGTTATRSSSSASSSAVTRDRRPLRPRRRHRHRSRPLSWLDSMTEPGLDRPRARRECRDAAARRIGPHRVRRARHRRRRVAPGSSSRAPRPRRWPPSSTACGSCCASRSPTAVPSSR